MEFIQLDQNLRIKKLDPQDEKDVWLVNELDKDELISGENGYLWPMGNLFNDVRYLFRKDMYASPYGIYIEEKPVGYIELSDILVFCHKETIDISYALLERERGKGYATKTLLEISKKILLDSKDNIQKIFLLIDEQNKTSRNVAKRAGFLEDSSVSFEEMVGYQKTKEMIKK